MTKKELQLLVKKLQAEVRELTLENIHERICTDEAVDEAADHLVANNIFHGYETRKQLTYFLKEKFNLKPQGVV